MNTLRSRLILYIVISGCLVLLIITSCDLFGTSINARLSKLESDLNKPYGSRYISENNFHSDLNGFYDGEDSFPGDLDASHDGFTITPDGSILDVPGQPGEKSLHALLNSNFSTNEPMDFHFKEDGTGNWKIHAMSEGGNTWGTF